MILGRWAMGDGRWAMGDGRGGLAIGFGFEQVGESGILADIDDFY